MKTIIYILRHGESESNKTGTFTGSNEVDLSELGLKQAEIAGEYLKDKGIEFIYSSPLSRAVKTAEPTSKKIGLPIVCDERFREVHFGSWEGKTKEYLAKNEPDFLLWRAHPALISANNGENSLEAAKRFACGLYDIAKRHAGSTLLVTAHGGVILDCMCYLGFYNKETATIDNISRNAGITKLVYDGEKFDMEFYGYDGYLGESKAELKLV